VAKREHNKQESEPGKRATRKKIPLRPPPLSTYLSYAEPKLKKIIAASEKRLAPYGIACDAWRSLSPVGGGRGFGVPPGMENVNSEAWDALQENTLAHHALDVWKNTRRPLGDTPQRVVEGLKQRYREYKGRQKSAAKRREEPDRHRTKAADIWKADSTLGVTAVARKVMNGLRCSGRKPPCELRNVRDNIKGLHPSKAPH
jgi:hypothetical protein